jgi:hypothetical protein
MTARKLRLSLASTCLSACALLLALSSFARPGIAQDDVSGQGATQSVQKTRKHKPQRSPGKEIGKGSEDIGKGAGKGAESLGKGTAGAAANLATLHPVGAATDLGKGAGAAGKNVGVGTVKGTAKIGKGSAKGVGRLGKKIVGKDGKKKSDE